jgi:hypothetical protein
MYHDGVSQRKPDRQAFGGIHQSLPVSLRQEGNIIKWYGVVTDIETTVSP